jgi:pimeloyl-ACP methyl ester carboxylesterase
MPYADVVRETLFYTVSKRAEGQGGRGDPALVLLHGAGGSRLNWPAKLRRLPGATVYTLDLPGHGRSSGRGKDTIEGYAEDVVAFLDTVGVERAILVGHSMGGAVALTLALGWADRVAGLVLVATGARLRVAPAILEGVHGDFEAALDIITHYAWSPGSSPALIESGRQRLREAGPDMLLGDLVACDRFDVMGRLEEIDAPTLVLAGSADQLTPVRYARFLVEHIAGACLVIVDGAGHMVMLERSTGVAKAVREFLEGPRPPRSSRSQTSEV